MPNKIAPPRRRPRTGPPCCTPSLAPSPDAALGQEAKQALADFLEALEDPQATAEAAPSDVKRLTDRATHLLDALHHQRDAGVLAGARDPLEEAVLASSRRRRSRPGSSAGC